MESPHLEVAVMSRFSAKQIGFRALGLALFVSLAASSSAVAKAKQQVPPRDEKNEDEPKADPRDDPKLESRVESEDSREVDPPGKKEDPEYRYDFGLFGGGHFFTMDHILGRRKDDPTTPSGLSPANSGMAGGHLGFHFNHWIGLEGEVNLIPTRTRDASPSANPQLWVFSYRGSFVLHLSDAWNVQPFLLAGYGGLTSLSGDSTIVRGDTCGFFHAGAGFQVGFTPMVGIRLDGRIMVPWTAVPSVPIGNRIGYTGPDFEVFGGLYINFGEVEKIHIYSNQKVIISAPKARPDKDGDGIPDDVDRCPNEPEDKDGFQDDDGCPDPDNDGDGIPDVLDKCPNDPEDKDGFQDEDGCPDYDNDHDGIPDNLDKCPNEPEDKDGFQDDDGCPDPDNDGDGIPDVIDKCPNQPETFNHYQDEDGCPDEVPAEVKKFTGVIEGINFKTGSAEILSGSYAILDRALKVLQDYPDVNLEISGHTDNKGGADYNQGLSQRRANSVKLYFVSRGIPSSRLVSIGYGKDRPIADNSTANGRATNRRTEFRLIDPGNK
jgi:OOP family OmpA-OmpF porin